jgi:hypothetical protein
MLYNKLNINDCRLPWRHRMGLRRLFSLTEEQTNKTQWTLVENIERQLTECQCPQVRQAVSLLLEQARAQASSPQCWAINFAQAVVGALEAFQATAVSAESTSWQAELLRLECATLRRALAEHKANPLQDQVHALTTACDESRTRAIQAEQLAEKLTTERKALQTEIADLQQTIGDLNRIVARQQEQLNASSK